MIAWTLMGGSSLNNWSIHHKVHHKYSDTDGDPHNTKRGIFFCHIGWIMKYPHPEYLDKKSSLIKYFNFMKDPVVKFNHDYYFQLVLITNLIVVIIPAIVMNYTLWESFLIAFILRSVIAYHWSFLINSAAHLYGSKPYDVNIDPVQNLIVSFGSGGEGYHNYHHSFPYDYAASEDGEWFNISKLFIESCSIFGWTYDLKRVTREQLIKCKLNVNQRNSLKVNDKSSLVDGKATKEIDSKVLVHVDTKRQGKHSQNFRTEMGKFTQKSESKKRDENNNHSNNNFIHEIFNYIFN